MSELLKKVENKDLSSFPQNERKSFQFNASDVISRLYRHARIERDGFTRLALSRPPGYRPNYLAQFPGNSIRMLDLGD